MELPQIRILNDDELDVVADVLLASDHPFTEKLYPWAGDGGAATVGGIPLGHNLTPASKSPRLRNLPPILNFPPMLYQPLLDPSVPTPPRWKMSPALAAGSPSHQ
jgi:hypothetical protein